jgi:hypothetical protein
MLERVPRWLQVEPPHFGTGCFSKAREDDYPCFVGDSDLVLGEGDGAVRVAKYTHAEEVVDKGWHDVATGSSWW